MIRKDREDEIRRFLARNGWQSANRKRIPGDASFRRYERLTSHLGKAILMDAPPLRESVGPFVRVGQFLKDCGLSAPDILASDVDAGFLLLEDLGDDIYTRILENGKSEKELYIAAVDALLVIHQMDIPTGWPTYDEQRYLDEVLLLTDWFMPLADLEISARCREDYVAIWQDLLPLAGRVPETVVLRDYHADNLIWLPDRAGPARVGQLDFQDAVIGPVSYDLVSLLEDARRDVCQSTVEAAIGHFLANATSIRRDDLQTSYAILGAQRNLKIIGIFCRLLQRDNKPGYLEYLPRVWEHVNRNIRHPALEPVAAWLDQWIPPAARTIPR